ncbi:MAG: Tex family protein [Thermotogota bacterium]|nr:Tex family protein [Thermotogota bacterium]
MTFNEMIQQIAEELTVKEEQVVTTVELLDDDKTIPFISRYRKEQTGALNEIQIRSIAEKIDYLRRLQTRREEVLSTIEEQGKLTEELSASINTAATFQAVEDLYLPYKKRKKTRADKAREKGLEPLSQWLKETRERNDEQIAIYVDEEIGVLTPEEALNGALDIIREEVANTPAIRDMLRTYLRANAFLISDQAYAPDPRGVYKDFYEFKRKLKEIPQYRILAIDRAEKDEVVKVKLDLNTHPAPHIINMMEFSKDLAYFEEIARIVEDAYKTLLFPSIEREIRHEFTQDAQKRAIEVFAKNLRNLMLTPPIKNKRVLGLDPGFRTGCKCAVVDENGIYKENTNIYPHPPHKAVRESEETLLDLIRRYKIDIISIGNGTASRETEAFVATMLEKNPKIKASYIIVSEAGASVYSASQNAIDEFPDLDVTTRGAVSIARRVQDPMAELVKIPPESIGVGMYQHDLNKKDLSGSLQIEVESVVNFVGVDLNSASPFLLQYISGLNKKTAWNILDYKSENGPFKSRKELKKVKGIGPKAYEQAAGFCRVPESENPLDNTVVHPEKYVATEQILQSFSFTIDDYKTQKDTVKKTLKGVNIKTLSEKLSMNPITCEDIIKALTTDYIDPRDSYPQPILKTDVKKLEDLSIGMQLQGTVRNVVDFGAFVDIGVKVDGLIHKSKFGKHNVDPLEEVYVGQIVNVEILKVDQERDRISLKKS